MEKLALRDIYDEEAIRYPEAALSYTFPKAESTMRTARRRHNPPIPGSLLDLGRLLVDPQWQMKYITTVNEHTEPILKYCINEESGQALMFASQTLIDTVIGGVEEIHIDGMHIQVCSCGSSFPPTFGYFGDCPRKVNSFGIYSYE